MRSSLRVDQTPKLIADRYRVDRLLGRGGMAEVYQVDDIVSGRVVALKRLLLSDAANTHVVRLFELEYYTLAQLAHPHIVEVHDYHTDDQGPFYTMELLTGGDLRQRAPLAWPELCLRLCNISSALALLHSRRLVHRDLTPMNVRCTLDDRTKLFDFGSMTQFGRPKHIVGTPPFIAPEALNGGIVDGQTDLYALGATAYYVLTGRHAYPARTLGELPDLWSAMPPIPSQLVPDIPPALDELIMTLINLAPSARLLSASEVIERLSAIGGFDAREDRVVNDAYLSKPIMVGRDEQSAAWARKLDKLIKGSGTTVLVKGAPGTGRSRVLDACALDAKLRGAVMLRADARDAGDRRWSAAGAMIEQLSQQLPELGPSLIAKRAELFEPVLGPSTRHSIGFAADGGDKAPAVERSTATRPEIQAALQATVLEVARERPLVLIVDDLDRVDEPSAALIALLATQARQHRLLLICSAGDESGSAGPLQRALQLIAAVAEVWSLRDLDRGQATQLVVSLFGDVPNVRLLADRMYTVTHGSPLLMMRVAQGLVRGGTCSYAAGIWTIPVRLDTEALHGALQETVDLTLSAPALELARALVLSGLDSVSLEECLRLTSHANIKALQADLHALSACGIAVMDEGEISLTRRNWEVLLLAELPLLQRQELHLRVAGVLEQRPGAAFRMLQQVLYAGQVERALDLLLSDVKQHRAARIADPARTFEHLQSLPKNWPETYHALIDACRSLGRPLCDRLSLQRELLSYSTLAARVEAASTMELAAQLRHDTGLDLIAELSDRVPAGELLAQALTAAQQRREALPEHERGLPLVEALTALGELIIQAIGTAGRTFDVSLLEAMPSLAPLAVLSPALTVVQKNLETSMRVLSGRSLSALEPYLEIARRVDEPDGAGLGNSHRVHMRAAVLWAAGMIEADLSRPTALERADAIEGNPLFAVSALQMRALSALHRGDRLNADRYHTQMERLQIQNCPPQLFEGTALPRLISAYTSMRDLLHVKQCLADIEAIARELPTWLPIVHYGRGAYQALRGDHVQAQSEFERSLSMMQPGRHVVWASCAGELIWSLAQQQLYPCAVSRGRQLLESAHEQQLEDSERMILVPLALAESHEGHIDAALQHIQRAIEVLSMGGACGVLLGAAYEVRARIAIQLGDLAAFDQNAASCRVQYGLGDDAVLLSRHKKLLRVANETLGLAISRRPAAASPALAPDELLTQVSTLLFAAQGPAERAEQALRLLARAMGCDGGFLYLQKPEGLTLVAHLGGVAPRPEMDGLVAKVLQDALKGDENTVSTVSDADDVISLWNISEDMVYMPMLLSHFRDQHIALVGVGLLAVPRRSQVLPPTRLLQALSKTLCDTGDAVTGSGLLDSSTVN
jgi:serine/threonine-protein kinase